MHRGQQPDAIDTRTVFRVYAALVGAWGFLLFAFGPTWFGSHFFGQPPWTKAAFLRVFGSILMAAACSALALAGVEDPASRRRGLYWFAGGHSIVLAVLLLQRRAIWGSGVADWAVQMLLAVVVSLFYAAWTSEGRNGLTILSGGILSINDRTPDQQLRSAYEARIRLAAGQEERNRLARDLHDSVKQQLFAIQTSAATVQQRFDADVAGAKQALEQVRCAARDAMTEMQVMLDQLRAAPLENVGLIEALKKQCETLGFRSGAKVEFQPAELPPSEAFVPGAHEAILRAAQEALANVARHARAKNVSVRLQPVGGRLTLSIQDDGAGFDPSREPSGMGLANIKARAEEFNGVYEMDSRPDAGTTVSFSVPYAVLQARDYKKHAALWAVYLLVLAAAYVWIDWWNNEMFLALTCLALITLVRATVACYRTKRRFLTTS